MSQLAVKLDQLDWLEFSPQSIRAPELALVAKPELSTKSKAFPVTRNVYFLGLILSILQIADGILTAIGVNNWGTSAEGNPLLRSMMNYVGLIPTLCLTKIIAIMVIFLLCKISSKVNWIPFALKCIIAIYLCSAVLPWSYLLICQLG